MNRETPRHRPRRRGLAARAALPSEHPGVRDELAFLILFLILLAALVLAGCRAGPPDENQPAGGTREQTTSGEQATSGEPAAPAQADDADDADDTKDVAGPATDSPRHVAPASPPATAPSNRVASGPTQLAAAGGEAGHEPEDLKLVATALWLSVQATEPPPPPLTGGADPGDAQHGGALPAEPPPGGQVWPTPTYGLPMDLSLTATAVWLPPQAVGADVYSTPTPQAMPREAAVHTGERYDDIDDNPFERVSDEPLSTFSIDVDTASYANVRRYINGGALPPPAAVRIEELLNYFDYDYPPPAPGSRDPFAVFVEVVEAPWQVKHRLVHIGIKGAELASHERPDSNLVFLIDVSGSMDDPAKLPLVKDALRLLVDEMGERDRVAIVTYAGLSSLVLPSTSGMDKVTIADAIRSLRPGGSTNGEAGLLQAYDVAREGFIEGGANRVVLATDGDFNVGVTTDEGLLALVREQAAAGVGLTALGFGMGNLKDGRLELLADNGDGNYAYIDTINEAHKVLVEQMSGTLTTIAKDVKIQVEFNPAEAAAYRLIGYENRALKDEQFADDTVDAGEIGAGHSVTALYEVVPVGADDSGGDTEADAGTPTLRYQAEGTLTDDAASGELLSLRLRYKPVDGSAPDGAPSAGRESDDGSADESAAVGEAADEPAGAEDTQQDAADAQQGAEDTQQDAAAADGSKLIEFRVTDTGKWLKHVHGDVQFAAAVAAYGMLLRGSPYAGNVTWDRVIELAEEALGPHLEGADEYGYKAEFLDLVTAVRQMQP